MYAKRSIISIKLELPADHQLLDFLAEKVVSTITGQNFSKPQVLKTTQCSNA